MEAKKGSAAIASVCVLLMMLPGQVQQVAAMSKFCSCFSECYPACRKNVVRFFCVPFCANKCSPSEATTAAAIGGGGGDSCWAACRRHRGIKICGLSDPPTEAADAATCAQNCKKELSRDWSSIY